MAHLTIGGDRFRVEVDGDAKRPALMMSHALGTDLTMWDGQVSILTRHFRVIRYDQRGHGGSDCRVVPMSIAALGRDALAIMDALEIERAHWLGLSMGGAVGLWLLANAPERIERAVLANTAPRIGTPETWNERITNVLSEGMAETAAATMMRWFSPDFARRDARRIDTIKAIVERTSPQAYAGCCAALRDMDLRETLGRIEHEVLVVSGRDDPVVPQGSALITDMSGARHVALNARHMSNLEAEVGFNTAVVSFLTAKLTSNRKLGSKSKPAQRRSPPQKTATSKTSAVKRGPASRRSNTARRPLKKATSKRSAAKTIAPARLAKKKAMAGARRQTVRTAATRRPTPNPPAKKGPAKSSRKMPKITARRPTPTGTARGIVVKKAKPAKTVAKTATKKTVAKSVKKPPVRRRPTGKSRRPTGRRKP